MATSETTNLQLVKYGAGTDNFIRTDYNGNLDKIDTFAGNTNQAITNLKTANYKFYTHTTLTSGTDFVCPADGYIRHRDTSNPLNAYYPNNSVLSLLLVPGTVFVRKGLKLVTAASNTEFYDIYIDE